MDTQADWDRMHRVDAKGVFFCLQTVEVISPRRGGCILNIASIAGKGYAGASNPPARGAVIAVTKTATQQRTALSGANLRVRAEQEGSP